MNGNMLGIPPGAPLFHRRYIPMSNPIETPSFFSRVITNDAAKKGFAGAVAGMLVAVVVESLWPSA